MSIQNVGVWLVPNGHFRWSCWYRLSWFRILSQLTHGILDLQLQMTIFWECMWFYCIGSEYHNSILLILVQSAFNLKCGLDGISQIDSLNPQGAVSMWKCCFTSLGIRIIKMRVFIMGITIPWKPFLCLDWAHSPRNYVDARSSTWPWSSQGFGNLTH